MTVIRITALVADPHSAPHYEVQVNAARWLPVSRRRYDRIEAAWDRRMDALI